MFLCQSVPGNVKQQKNPRPRLQSLELLVCQSIKLINVKNIRPGGGGEGGSGG